LDLGVAEPCQLRDIAAEVIVALAPTALEKGVQLELLAGDEAIVVRGNPGLLRVLLRNLLDNSIRHSPPGTTVQVSITQESGAVCLSVSDNGPGIRSRSGTRCWSGSIARWARRPAAAAWACPSSNGLPRCMTQPCRYSGERRQGLRVAVSFKS